MSLEAPHSEVTTTTTVLRLYDLPKELSDGIFDTAAADDDVIFDHATQTAHSKSSLLTVGRKVAADYRKALERRKDNFRKHRITVNFDLPDDGSRSEFPPVGIGLPRCAWGVHLIIKIDKSRRTREWPPYFTDEVFPNLSIPLKTAIEGLELENVLIEVHIVDTVHSSSWSGDSNIDTCFLYEQVLEDLRELDWKGGEHPKPTRIRSAIVGHHQVGLLATPDPSSPQLLHVSAFFRRNGSLAPRARALLDTFHSSKRMSRAIRNGPNPDPVGGCFTTMLYIPEFFPEEVEYPYRGFDAVEMPVVHKID
jgi:hypothetical protein